MKKIMFCTLLMILWSLSIEAQTDKSILSSTQNNKDTKSETNDFRSIIRFKPAATIVALALYQGIEIGATYVHYVHPRIGIPVDLEFAYVYEMFGFSILTGIEAVPAIHREKSGLYLNFEAGIVCVEEIIGFASMTNIGYQLVTKKRFVFTPAIGLKYDGISRTVGLNIMLDIGFAF